MPKYYVAITEGPNADGVPEGFVTQRVPIRVPGAHGNGPNAFEFAARPALPDEYAGNPRATVMSEDELSANHAAHTTAYQASARVQKGLVYKRRISRFDPSLAGWKQGQRDKGVIFKTYQVPCTDENVATIGIISAGRTSIPPASFPLFLFDGAVRCDNARDIQDLEAAMGVRLATIESQASGWYTRAASATTVAELDVIDAEMAAAT